MVERIERTPVACRTRTGALPGGSKLYHAVELEITEDGAISGRVPQAFARSETRASF